MRILVTGVILAVVAGCSSGGDEQAAKSDSRTKVGYSSYELYGGPGAPQGALDPVSGEWVPRDTAYRTLYDGLSYYFASKDNMESFERHPDDFVTADGYLKKPIDEVRRDAQVK